MSLKCEDDDDDDDDDYDIRQVNVMEQTTSNNPVIWHFSEF